MYFSFDYFGEDYFVAPWKVNISFLTIFYFVKSGIIFFQPIIDDDDDLTPCSKMDRRTEEAGWVRQNTGRVDVLRWRLMSNSGYDNDVEVSIND